jgi:hypothetical protein
MQISQTLDRRFEPNPVFDELCEVMMPSAPVNTLQNEAVAPTYITGKWKKIKFDFSLTLSMSETRA